MSVHVEWMDAASTAASILTRGQTLDGEPVEDSMAEPITGEMALVFDADEVVVIEGTRAHIERLLTTALDRLADTPA